LTEAATEAATGSREVTARRVPTMVLFALAGRWVVEGPTAGSVKE
jgi:ABC-type maltose transport system permease subunit